MPDLTHRWPLGPVWNDSTPGGSGMIEQVDGRAEASALVARVANGGAVHPAGNPGVHPHVARPVAWRETISPA